MRRLPIIPPLLLIVALLVACSSRPAVPRAAVRLTLTVDGLLQSYTSLYNLQERVADTPQQIAEEYLRIYQPGPLPRVFEHSVVRDRNGTLLNEWVDEGRRTWVPLSQMAPELITAVIATEDASFYDNVGIDPRRLLGAVIQNAEVGEIISGASTITMQLARNLFFPYELRFDQSVERKGYEALLAQELTVLYTKEEILEMYLNLIYFGHNSYGVEAAAQTYFDKSAADLNLSEATIIAGFPQAPANYDPFVNYAAAKFRQRTVLDLMVRHGHLDAEQANRTFGAPIHLATDPDTLPKYAPHFVTFLREEVQSRLGEMRADRAGLHITTTLDLPMQQLAEQIVSEQVAALRPAYDLSNAALVALKPGSAEILVMVGSANFDDNSIQGKVNVAVSLRQPGSAIKPILYASALDANLISPATVFWDLPVEYKLADNETYRPQNYDEKFHGPVTARTALANSYNIPAVKLLDAVGVERMLDEGRAMGLLSLADDPARYGLSLTLGGGEVRLLDLATAYHTIANGGSYLPYRAVVRVEDGQGGEVELFPEPEPQRVISAAAAFQVTSILSDQKAREPAFGANSLLNLSRPAAAKTGTTTSYRDNWTMGYSRYLITGVWAGNSDGRPMRGVTGVTGAGPIWNQFMEAVMSRPDMLRTLGAPETVAGWEFLPPDSVALRTLQCPRRLDCSRELEYFSKAWLAHTARTGVMSDGVIARDKVSAVLINGRTVGACSDAERGNDRTLFRMPVGIGLLAPATEDDDVALVLAISPNLPVPRNRPQVVEAVPGQVVEQVKKEREEVMRWIVQNNSLLHLGPCAEIEPLVDAMYGPSANIVISALPALAASSTISGTLSISDTAPLPDTQSVAEQSPEPEQTAQAVPQPAMTTQYQLVAAGPGGGCSSNLILGSVTAADGSPLPGVRVVAVDQYGNRAETASKEGATDYGRFDISVGGTQNNYYVTLVDGAGTAISATAIITHMQPPEGNACYWVQFRAG